MRQYTHRFIIASLISAAILPMSGCGKEKAPEYDLLVSAAKSEGELNSLAMPDDWANWKETWKDISVFYGIKHDDTDMNSAEELQNFKHGVGDIGDVGYSIAGQAEKENLTLRYITSYWDEIPDWAKDNDGDWMVAYTGTLAFMVKNADKDVYITWHDLENGSFTIGTSDVRTSSQAQYTVYAAALAFGGNKDNIQPGIDFFKKLANEGRLSDALDDEEKSINSDIDVNIKWDFNALGYRDTAQEKGKKYGVCIPADGSVTVGYASVINKKAKHPNAAMLAREYIFSDAGQLNLASGYATPIRSIILPSELEEKRIARGQYTKDMVRAGLEFNDKIADKIADEWNKQVLPILNERGRAS